MKRCAMCRVSKPEAEFYTHCNKCKDCVKRLVRMRRRNNEKVREYDRKRSKLPHRIEHLRRISREWRIKNPEGYRAQTALGNAVRDGKIKRLPCEVCGNPRSHGHHRDYSKPLDVIWLCARHHHGAHGITRPV